MNTLTIETIDQTFIELKIPESLSEITFAQLLALQKAEITNFEALSILSGVPIDDLYAAKSYETVSKMAKIYVDLFSYSTMKADLNKMPKKVIVQHAGIAKTIKIKKFMAIEPAGAYVAASKIIVDEIQAHIDLFGEEKWQENFNPSLTACAGVVDEFLRGDVVGKAWAPDIDDKLAINMKAADVLVIAKHFFNAFPKLNSYKQKSKIELLYKWFLAGFKTLFSMPGVRYTPDGVKHMGPKDDDKLKRVAGSIVK